MSDFQSQAGYSRAVHAVTQDAGQQTEKVASDVPFTTEQLLSLSESEHHSRSSRNFAVAHRWLEVGISEAVLWGSFPNKQNPPLAVQVNLAPLSFSCTCSQRSHPCYHALGLALLLVQEPELVERRAVPDWLVASAPAPFVAGAAPAALGSTGERYKQLMDGLLALELWLHDLLSGGLEAARNKPRAYWTAMADRLVDARASSLAVEVKAWANYTVKQAGADWYEQLLTRMGEMQLLIEGFKRLDALPQAVQYDLKARVGWRSKESLEPAIRDIWTVLGRQREGAGRQRLERVWLWGQTSRQFGLLVHTLGSQGKRDTTLLTGLALEAEVRYYPGSAPLQAELARHMGYCAAPTVPAQTDLREALAAIAQQRTLNPWLQTVPLLLSSVHAEQINDRWHLRDAAGYLLPLPAKFAYGWQLLALSRVGNLTLFGEWDGATLTPLSLFTLDAFLDMRVLKGHQ